VADDKLYQLPKSGLRLSGLTLSRLEGETLIADHSLGDLTEVVLRTRRTAGDLFGVFLFGLFLAGAVAGVYFSGFRAGSVLGGSLFSVAAFILFIIFIGMLTSRSRFLVVRGKSGEVSYPIVDDEAVAEAFFSEVREHAHAQRLMIGFRIDR
jgi:hypothetical protein